jgi:hypothetical protein
MSSKTGKRQRNSRARELFKTVAGVSGLWISHMLGSKLQTIKRTDAGTGMADAITAIIVSARLWQH